MRRDRSAASEPSSASAASARVVRDAERAGEHVGRPARAAARARCAVPARPSAASLSVPSPASTATTSTPSSAASARELGRVSAPVGLDDLDACARRAGARSTSRARARVVPTTRSGSRCRTRAHGGERYRSYSPASWLRTTATKLDARSTREIVECRACPRLVEWRERSRAEKRAAFRDEHLLGSAGARVRRPRGPGAGRRARAGRARRQPHRPGVHRRPLGRLAVRGAAPRRLRQPADVGAA